MEALTKTYCPSCKKEVSNVLIEFVEYPGEHNLSEIRIACEKDNTTLIEM